MSCMSWNCCGLGNQTAIQVLVDLVHTKRPSVLFLMETYLNATGMEHIRIKLGFKGLFVVDNVGHRGGIAFLWRKELDLQVIGYSNNHIDTAISIDAGRPKWRFTGFYKYPERSRRRESWRFLKRLSSVNDMAWVIMGDFNDMMYVH